MITAIIKIVSVISIFMLGLATTFFANQFGSLKPVGYIWIGFFVIMGVIGVCVR